MSFPLPSETSPRCLYQLALARLSRVVEKRSWFAFARSESEVIAGQVSSSPLLLFSVHSRRVFVFWFFTSRCEDVGERVTVNFPREFDQKKNPCANSIFRACLTRYRMHVLLSFVFEKKERNKVILHLNNMLIHIFDYTVIKVTVVGPDVSTHSPQTQRPLAALTVSKQL